MHQRMAAAPDRTTFTGQSGTSTLVNFPQKTDLHPLLTFCRKPRNQRLRIWLPDLQCHSWMEQYRNIRDHYLLHLLLARHLGRIDRHALQGNASNEQGGRLAQQKEAPKQCLSSRQKGHERCGVLWKEAAVFQRARGLCARGQVNSGERFKVVLEKADISLDNFSIAKYNLSIF